MSDNNSADKALDKQVQENVAKHVPDPTNKVAPADDIAESNTIEAEVENATELASSGQVEFPLDTDPVQVGHRQGMFGAKGDTDTSGYGGLSSPILFPGDATRPYGDWFDEAVDTLVTSGGIAPERVVVDRGELTLFVRAADLPAVARTLRDDPALRFEMCTGVSGVNYPDETGRELHAVYHLLSLTHGGRRVRLEVAVSDDDRRIPSVVAIWPGADWHERETWDMFGILFEGHPSLTRILMPDDWPGHPQRKDYPLGGIPVEYKGGTVPPPDQRRSYN